jgi:hypothetical protein
VGGRLRTYELDVSRSRNDGRLTDVNHVSHGYRAKDVSQIRNVMNAVGGHPRTYELDVHRHRGLVVNLIRNGGRGLEVLVTSRDACHRQASCEQSRSYVETLLSETCSNRLSPMRIESCELGESRFRNDDQLMDVRRGCRELDARREKKMCGVVCASSELRRWCHLYGEQPWRVERLR